MSSFVSTFADAKSSHFLINCVPQVWVSSAMLCSNCVPWEWALYLNLLQCRFSLLTPSDACVSKLSIIGSDNGLPRGRDQAIFWTNDGILLIGTLGTNICEILRTIHTFAFRKMHSSAKMSSAKCWSFCLGLNVLRDLDLKGRVVREVRRVEIRPIRLGLK